MREVLVRCRTCGRIAYKRGPCPTCRVYGEYGPTDVVEVHLYGTVRKLKCDLARSQKEAREFRRLYQESRASEDRLRERVQRSMRARERLGRVALAVERARGEMA